MDKGILKEETGVSNGLVGCPRQYDLLINSQGFRCSFAAVSNASEPSGNSLKRLLGALREWFAIAAVQLVSPGRNTRRIPNNYAETSRVFFVCKINIAKENFNESTTKNQNW